jgi:hypothetical protein
LVKNIVKPVDLCLFLSLSLSLSLCLSVCLGILELTINKREERKEGKLEKEREM